MKQLIPVLLIILLIFSSCHKNNNLEAEGYMFFRVSAYDSQEAVPDAQFKPGETIVLYLFNVGPLMPNSDLQYKINLDVEIRNSKNKKIFERKNYYSTEKGNTFNDSIIQFLFAMWQASPNMDPGIYTFKMSIQDKESGNKIIYKPQFTLIRDN